MTVSELKHLRPWDRQPGEPDEWYERFRRYYLKQDPIQGRSINRAYTLWRRDQGMLDEGIKVSGHWRQVAATWRWADRARAYDDYMHALEEEEEIQERRQWRKWRRAVLRAFAAKIHQALKEYEPKKVTLGELTKAIQVVLEQLRAEYQEVPPQRVELYGDIGHHHSHTVDYSQLDDEALRAILARRSRSGDGGEGPGPEEPD